MSEMEVLGNATDAKVFVKIQYCGGWGYRPRCVKFIEEMGNDALQYKLLRDPGRTGNFEVTVYKTEDLSDEGVVIYQKSKTSKFPMDDGMDAVKEAINACWEHPMSLFKHSRDQFVN